MQIAQEPSRLASVRPDLWTLNSTAAGGKLEPLSTERRRARIEKRKAKRAILRPRSTKAPLPGPLWAGESAARARSARSSLPKKRRAKRPRECRAARCDQFRAAQGSNPRIRHQTWRLGLGRRLRAITGRDQSDVCCISEFDVPINVEIFNLF